MGDMDKDSRIPNYLPGWQFEPADGQPEAALLYAGWQLLEDTRRRMEALPQKHEREFLNAWPLSPREPEPMRTCAVLRAPEGERLAAGSEVYLSGNGVRLWKTVQPVTAQSMELVTQILESAETGKLIEISPPTEQIPSRLFDFRHRGTQKNALRIAHPDTFRSGSGAEICLQLPECEPSILECLTDPARVRWSLECDEQVECPLETPVQRGQSLWLKLPAARGCALTAQLEPGFPVPAGIIGSITVSVTAPEQCCSRILTDEETVQTETFAPFGAEPAPWSCCYLAAQDVLRLRGGEVRVEFFLSMQEREEALPGPERKPKYRSIMLHMPPPPPPVPELRADHVVWEYWNGSAWLPIPGTVRESGLFADCPDPRRVSVRFSWPEDAAACEVQGQKEVWIRWRITRADGMGLLPRRVFAPQVQKVRMENRLENAPAALSVCSGLGGVFLPLKREPTARLFSSRASQADGWWLCFDRAPVDQTLQLYLEFAGRVAGTDLCLWESTRKGMKSCSCHDGTDGLSHSGVLSLTDLDGDLTERFGKRGWWLCISDRENHMRRSGVYPRMTGLFCGAVVLEAEQEDQCEALEQVSPLRGGAVTGETLCRSFGGAAAETDREQLLRAERSRHHLGRAVSPLDVQELVQEHFREVIRTRCKRRGSRMEIAVLLRDIHQHSAAFAHRREEIVRLLDQRSVLPVMGLEIEVREPNFYPVQATVWLDADPDSAFQSDRDEVIRAMNRFLNPVTGKFRGDGWHIGELPAEQELCNDLKIQLPGLKLVKLLLTVLTPDGQEMECSRIRDPFALPVPGVITVREVRGEEI